MAFERTRSSTARTASTTRTPAPTRSSARAAAPSRSAAPARAPRNDRAFSFNFDDALALLKHWTGYGPGISDEAYDRLQRRSDKIIELVEMGNVKVPQLSHEAYTYTKEKAADERSLPATRDVADKLLEVAERIREKRTPFVPHAPAREESRAPRRDDRPQGRTTERSQTARGRVNSYRERSRSAGRGR